MGSFSDHSGQVQLYGRFIIASGFPETEAKVKRALFVGHQHGQNLLSDINIICIILINCRFPFYSPFVYDTVLNYCQPALH